MTILVSSSMFRRSSNPMVSIVLTYDLDLSGHDLCKIKFWAISQLIMDKILPHFNTR